MYVNILVISRLFTLLRAWEAQVNLKGGDSQIIWAIDYSMFLCGLSLCVVGWQQILCVLFFLKQVAALLQLASSKQNQLLPKKKFSFLSRRKGVGNVLDGEIKVQSNASKGPERRKEIIDDKSRVVSGKEDENFEMMVILWLFCSIWFVVFVSLLVCWSDSTKSFTWLYKHGHMIGRASYLIA